MSIFRTNEKTLTQVKLCLCMARGAEVYGGGGRGVRGRSSVWGEQRCTGGAEVYGGEAVVYKGVSRGIPPVILNLNTRWSCQIYDLAALSWENNAGNH